MRFSEFHTLKLAEECTELSKECSELAQRCLKTVQFGENEVQDGQELTNRERLQAEANDVIAMLFIMNLIPEASEYMEVIEAKRKKLGKYLKLSREKGCVDEQ